MVAEGIMKVRPITLVTLRSRTVYRLQRHCVLSEIFQWADS